MNTGDLIPKVISDIDWPKAYEYRAYNIVEELVRAEIDRRRGASYRGAPVQHDPCNPYLEQILRDLSKRTSDLYKEAYMKRNTNEEANPNRSGGEAPLDVAGR